MSHSRWPSWKGWIAPLLFIPSAAAAQGNPGPICTDRPAKANAVCTVPAGAFQVETNAFAWSLAKLAGLRSEVVTLGSSFVKLGLGGRSDIELGFTPYVEVTTRTGRARDRLSGFGDIVVRYKQRLTGDSARLQVAAIPFVKLPTARSGLGNGKVEGGLAVPISAALGAASITLGPEVDLLADTDGRGRHAALVNLVNFAAPLTKRLTVGAEFWSNLNLDPAGTVRQVSLDGAFAYAVSRSLQLDAGANFGLTSETPDVEVYAGASYRF